MLKTFCQVRHNRPKQIAFRASRFVTFERLVSALAIELALRCPPKLSDRYR